MNQKQIAKCLDIEYKMYQDYPEGLNAKDGLVEFAKRIAKPFNGLSDIDLVLLGDYFRTGQQVLRNSYFGNFLIAKNDSFVLKAY